MAASTKKKAKPKVKSKPKAKALKAAPKSVKASLAKPAKAKPGKSLPAKAKARSAAPKTAAKKPVPKPAKPAAKKPVPKPAKPAAKKPVPKPAKPAAKKPVPRPAKPAVKKPAPKPAKKAVKQPLPKPAKPAAKKVALSKKGKSAPVTKPTAAKAKPVKPGKPSRQPVSPAVARKQPVKPQSKKDLKAKAPVAKPVEQPVANSQPVKPQVVITKPRPTLRQILPPPPPPPAPKPEVRKPASAAALRAFEHAVKVFNRRQFEEAKGLFEQLHQKFPLEVELLSRSQMYLQVCRQKLIVAPVPQVRNVSADEWYDRGVLALNVGDFAQARNFFEKALRLDPNEPHFLYSLAATYAQTGPHEQALDYLRRSIQLQPRFRSQAFDDNDFSGLRENRQFQELLGLTSPFDLLEARR